MQTQTLTVAIFIVFANAGESQTLRELSRKQGAVEMVLNTEYAPTTLAELAVRADVVVEGNTSTCASSLTADERSIDTDCTVQVARVFKGNTAGGTIKLRRPGGTVYIEGQKVTVMADASATLDSAKSYILFLKRDDASRTFSLLFGPQGVLTVANDTVIQDPGLGPDEEVPSMTLDDFQKALADSIAQAHK
jgi:hypothetical protein